MSENVCIYHPIECIYIYTYIYIWDYMGLYGIIWEYAMMYTVFVWVCEGVIVCLLLEKYVLSFILDLFFLYLM